MPVDQDPPSVFKLGRLHGQPLARELYKFLRYLEGLAESGVPGPQGPQGPQGVVGATGAQGATGPQGSTGAQGATGVQGATGAQGSVGPQGAQGVTGAQGVQGAQGPVGYPITAVYGSFSDTADQPLTTGQLVCQFDTTDAADRKSTRLNSSHT